MTRSEREKFGLCILAVVFTVAVALGMHADGHSWAETVETIGIAFVLIPVLVGSILVIFWWSERADDPS